MTQYGYEPLSPDDSGSTLLERLNGVVPALLTNHKGAARPRYVQPGMMWIDDSGATWLLNLYDGNSDVAFAAIDPATHSVSLLGLPDSYFKSAYKADGTPDAPVLYGAGGQLVAKDLAIDDLVGTNRWLTWKTKGLDRWGFRAGTGAEAGGNAGSDLGLQAFDDTGASLGLVFNVARSTQVLDFAKMPTVAGAALSSLVGGAVAKNVVDIGATGNYTPSVGTKFILAIMRGGGGGGGNKASSTDGSGGGEGGIGFAFVPVAAGTPYACVVGAGGAATGGGGTTSISIADVTFSATGGAAGASGNYSAPGAGGVPSSQCLFGQQGASGTGTPGGSSLWRVAGSAAYGRGGSGGAQAGVSSAAGSAGTAGRITILEFGS